jgi:uncharacterized membrane protein
MTVEENMKVTKNTRIPKMYNYIRGSIKETLDFYVERYYGFCELIIFFIKM